MRCHKLHGTWSETTCIGFQDADRIQCRDCHRGAAIRKAHERKKAGKVKVETDVEELKDKAEKESSEFGVRSGKEKLITPRPTTISGINPAGIQLTPTPDIVPEEVKWCPKCEQFKLRNSENFGTDLRYKDGFRSYCRVCDRIVVKNSRLKKLRRESEILPPQGAVQGSSQNEKLKVPQGNRINGRKKSACSLLIEGYGPPLPADLPLELKHPAKTSENSPSRLQLFYKLSRSYNEVDREGMGE